MRAVFAIALALAAGFAGAQQPNPLRIGSLLPAHARDVNIKKVPTGSAQYQVVDLRAWAVQGNSVSKLVVNLAGDAAQAKRYALEMLGKLKRADFGKP